MLILFLKIRKIIFRQKENLRRWFKASKPQSYKDKYKSSLAKVWRYNKYSICNLSFIRSSEKIVHYAFGVDTRILYLDITVVFGIGGIFVLEGHRREWKGLTWITNDCVRILVGKFFVPLTSYSFDSFDAIPPWNGRCRARNSVLIITIVS